MAIMSYEIFKQHVPNYAGALKAIKTSDAKKLFKHDIELRNPCNNIATREGSMVSEYQRHVEEFITKLIKESFEEQKHDVIHNIYNRWIETDNKHISNAYNLDATTTEKIEAIYNNLEKYEIIEMHKDIKKLGLVQSIQRLDYENYRGLDEYREMLKEHCAYEVEAINKGFENFFSGSD